MFHYITEAASMTIKDRQVVVELKIKQTVIILLSDKVTITVDSHYRYKERHNISTITNMTQDKI